MLALLSDVHSALPHRIAQKWRATHRRITVSARSQPEPDRAAAARDHAPRLAVLIDADNAQYSLSGRILQAAEEHGHTNIRRAYGDWASPCLQGWRDPLHQYGIRPIQQFAWTKRKNATDSAMIIDAMDLLHSGRVDGFCLVSSDSDFGPLALRILEQGLPVYGFGNSATPSSFMQTCTRFIVTDDLGTDEIPGATEPLPLVEAASTAPVLTNHLHLPAGVEGTLLRAGELASPNGGWVEVSTIGDALHTHYPGFEPRRYCSKGLAALLERCGRVEVIRFPDRTPIARVRS